MRNRVVLGLTLTLVLERRAVHVDGTQTRAVETKLGVAPTREINISRLWVISTFIKWLNGVYL